MTFAGLNPGSTDRRRRKPLISNPAPASRMRAKASSAVTRKLHKGLRETPVAVVRAFSRNASAISPRNAVHAGRRPNTSPVSSETANTNMKTRASMGIASKRRSSAGLNASNNVVPAFAANSPTAPPMSANRVLSVILWRISRPLRAPSEARIISSRCRATPRAISSIAKFAQAISSTSPTAPNRTSNAGRRLPTSNSCSGISTVPRSLSVSGKASASRWSACAISAWASANDTPGFRRQ